MACICIGAGRLHSQFKGNQPIQPTLAPGGCSICSWSPLSQATKSTWLILTKRQLKARSFVSRHSLLMFCVQLHLVDSQQDQGTVEPGQAEWRKFEGGKAHKEKGEPIGAAPDRLAGTAVDPVISWKSWSLTFLALDILVWWCRRLLIWLVLVIFESWEIFWLHAVCLERSFSPWHFFSWHTCLMMPLALDPVCACHFWILTGSSGARGLTHWSKRTCTWSSYSTAIYTPEFYFAVEDSFECKRTKTTPVAQTRFPTSMPGDTLCEKAHNLVRFPTPNITLTQQSQCDLQSLPCKSHKNYVEQGCKNAHEWSSHSTAICVPEFNFTV